MSESKKRYEDKNVTRVDIRIPNEVYEEIEKIAVLTNQPFTPKSKNSDNPKPIVTPVILKGLELVLMSMKDDLISELSEGKITNTQIVNDNLEERIFNRLEKKLEALIEARLSKVKADTITPESEDLFNESSIDPPPEIVNEVIKEDVSALDVINDGIEVKKNSLVNETIFPNNENLFNESSIEPPPERIKYHTYLEARKKVLEIYNPVSNTDLPEGMTNKEREVTKYLKENNYFNQRGTTLWYEHEVNSAYYEELNSIEIDKLKAKLADLPKIISPKELAEILNCEVSDLTFVNRLELYVSAFLKTFEKEGNNYINEYSFLIDTEVKIDNSEPINEDIKSFDEAVTVATKLKKDGLGNTAIAKELTGKFYTKANKTNWSDTQVRRLFETKK